MNFLAHIYLSGDNDLVKIGNFMADAIQGNKIDHFPPNVQKGILLHRAIDSHTDAHPIFRQGTKRLHKHYHHYSGVIMDMFYDHLLAKNWNRYCNTPLPQYAATFYKSLDDNYDILAPRTQRMMVHLKKEDWLSKYATIEGISFILMQMDYRTKHKSGMTNAGVQLQQYYTEYEQEFFAFFEDMQKFVADKKTELGI